MENLKPADDSNEKPLKEDESLNKSPKILEYIDRIRKGETIESFGKLPDSWTKAIQEGLEEPDYTITVEKLNTDESVHEKEIEDLKNKISGILREKSEQETRPDVEENLREYLLTTVDERFTKDVARKVATENIEKATNKELYKIALEQFYQDARIGEYDRTNELFDIDVENVTKESNDLIKRVQDENGWHYRIPKTSTTANKSENRISLNVWGNKELIDRLDKLSYKYGIYYKTPAQSDSWNERNDPVTIYINNPNLTLEQLENLKQEVIDETSGFIRSNEGFGIYGDNLSSGVEFGPESSVQEIQRLKNEAENISPELREAFDEYLRRDGKEKSSVGMNLAAQKLLNSFSEGKE